MPTDEALLAALDALNMTGACWAVLGMESPFASSSMARVYLANKAAVPCQRVNEHVSALFSRARLTHPSAKTQVAGRTTQRRCSSCWRAMLCSPTTKRQAEEWPSDCRGDCCVLQPPGILCYLLHLRLHPHLLT